MSRALVGVLATFWAGCSYSRSATEFLPHSDRYVVTTPDGGAVDQTVVSDGLSAMIRTSAAVSGAACEVVVLRASEDGLRTDVGDALLLPNRIRVGEEWVMRRRADDREECRLVRRVVELRDENLVVETSLVCGAQAGPYERERWRSGVGLVESENLIHGSKVSRRRAKPESAQSSRSER